MIRIRPCTFMREPHAPSLRATPLARGDLNIGLVAEVPSSKRGARQGGVCGTVARDDS